MQKKELDSIYNTLELIKVLCNVVKIFFDHSVMLRITIVRWANNETAAIEIIPTTHQKKWRHIVYRLKPQLSPINCTRLYE